MAAAAQKCAVPIACASALTTPFSEYPQDMTETTDARPEFGLQEPVKLVVWDLDETFWAGTLSEGAVEIADANADVVRQLNRRGIVSAICSKNEFVEVEERLRSEGGLWDEFVFPRIGWTPKGQTIARLIADMQLRPPNVLFIDDNVGNLREAAHYAQGLQIAGPEIISELLLLPQLQGKVDHELSRLCQYRQLQHKLADQSRSDVSNDEFLRSCAIRVDLETRCGAETGRLLELINRTNQLNYTKRRLTEAEFDALLCDPDRTTGYVRVHDRYGDYGICGFYSVRHGVLTDFLFSCRILHMGVETWLYQQLECPTLTTLGEVATPIDPTRTIDWINKTDATPSGRADVHPRGAVRAKVLLKGGCDLIQVNDFLAGSLKTELSYTNEHGAYVEWHHTEIMRRSTPSTVAQYGETIDRLPFLSRTDYATRVFDPNLDVTHIALSLLNEYGQGLYRLRGTGFIVPYGQYYTDITEERHWDELERQLGHTGMRRPFLDWFAREFEYLGALPLDRFQANIRWLATSLPTGKTLVLINGAEVEVSIDDDPSSELHVHQHRYNQALDAVAAELANVRVCDVRAFIRSSDDVTYNTRHYSRKGHLELAEALRIHTEAQLRVVERRPAVILMRRLARLLSAPGLARRIVGVSRDLLARRAN